MENTINVSIPRVRFMQKLLSLPEVATHSKALLTRIGLTILGRIKRAFIVKARGGTDETGDKWAPLSKKTIAYSRRGRTATERKREARPSQGLTKKQQDRWWEVYRRALAQHKGDKGHAAAVAWVVLKKEGAKTLLDKYGNRKVEILRNDGLLLNSLSPGSGSPDQIFQVGDGVITLGTNRKGAMSHHLGDPSRNLPQRRLWPDPKDWPSSWWDEILEQAKEGLLEIAINLLRGIR